MGIRHNPDAFSTKNISMASVAVSFLSLSDCNSCIALSPNGVAALSSPSILADTFMKIDPMAGCPLGIPGKSREKSGLIRRPKNCITPPRSPIFIKPIHSERMPVRPIEILKACSADVNEASIICDHIARLPSNNVSPKATRKAIAKNAIQM